MSDGLAMQRRVERWPCLRFGYGLPRGDMSDGLAMQRRVERWPWLRFGYGLPRGEMSAQRPLRCGRRVRPGTGVPSPQVRPPRDDAVQPDRRADRVLSERCRTRHAVRGVQVA